MTKTGTWPSNIGGLRATTTDCPGWRPSWLAAMSLSLSHRAALPLRSRQKPRRRNILVVFETGADPVAEGLVASLNRPGGNLTARNVTEFASWAQATRVAA